jgi:hypothetical protein
LQLQHALFFSFSLLAACGTCRAHAAADPACYASEYIPTPVSTSMLLFLFLFIFDAQASIQHALGTSTSSVSAAALAAVLLPSRIPAHVHSFVALRYANATRSVAPNFSGAVSWWGIVGAGSDDRVAQQLLQVRSSLHRMPGGCHCITRMCREPCSTLRSASGASPSSSGGHGTFTAESKTCALA